MSEIHFFVPGNPRAQGSKRGIVHKHTGRVVMIESCKSLKDWRASISYHAAKDKPAGLLTGPVRLILRFNMQRPKKHFGTGKCAGRLRIDAPRYPTGKTSGDIEKLIRAVCDALTGVIWVDDSQVVIAAAVKTYAGPGENCGVHVTIRPAESEVAA